MLKRLLFASLFVVYCPVILAGNFFNVVATGPAAQLSLTLCLNGKGPISCQNYTVAASNLQITTNIPNHIYPNAGVKINTPGFLPAGCTMASNGYCLFSANNTVPITLPVASATCLGVPGAVTFSPTVTRLNNPANNIPNAPQQFSINMTLCNSKGQAVMPSSANPIHVNVYGAPQGVITPTATTSSTGLVTLTYNGQAFPNNISLNAWMTDSSNNGAMLGVTSVLKQNAVGCTHGSTNYAVPLTSTLPNALQVQADVGYDAIAPSTSFVNYTLDTGSLGVIVPKSELPNNANIIGPGPAGIKYYDSSGNTYSGNYYLAPVRIKLMSGNVQTQPMVVLAIDKAYCTGPTDRSCYSNPPTPNLHYMGVGFNRNGTIAGDLFNSPSANAFLHINNANNGTDVSPGYYLTPGDNSAATGLVIGITSTSGYNVVSLTPNPLVPGDFDAQAGCYSFPGAPAPNQFCGKALLDIGIDYMFIDLPRARWPAGTYDVNSLVPAGTNMSVLMGSSSSPSLSYSFNAVQNNPPSNSATPVKVQWIDSASTGQIFFNTGRRPLYLYNYLYDGQCGQVGFMPLP